DGTGDGRSDAGGSVRPGEQRDQGERPEKGDEDVAHAVSTDADQPQRAGRPGRRDEAGPFAEAPAEQPDPEHSRHADPRGCGSQSQGRLAGKSEYTSHQVGEQRLTPTAIGEEDRMESWLGEKSMRRESLDGLVGVEAAGVVGQVPE